MPSDEVEHKTTVELLIKDMLGKDKTAADEAIIKDVMKYCKQIRCVAGQSIFKNNTKSDSFYMVIEGQIAVPKNIGSTKIISGAGGKKGRTLSTTNLSDFLGAEGEENEENTSTVQSFMKVSIVLQYFKTNDTLLNYLLFPNEGWQYLRIL